MTPTRNGYNFESSLANIKKELKRIEWTEVEIISKSTKDQKSQASIQ